MPAPELNDAQRRRLYELFDRAVDLEEQERAAFCVDQCGADARLRRRLEQMLGAVPVDDDAFLQAPVMSLAAGAELAAAQGAIRAAADAPLPDPEQIGPYRIVERLGEGGMGVVYRAEQQEPVRRQVALKVIKPGMDSARVLARFDAERQALALMDHPGIARIHDGGATAEGRPFFVMELVEGEAIHDFCRSHRVPTRDRLALFCRLCDAVQHAHQKGVIHRDLKPSNVLVVARDGKPHPIIIDFGIARAMAEPLGDHTRLTRQHEMVGTLEYMAPEQAGPAGNGRADCAIADVDSRADIYSLGVMLFELLTGELPFDPVTPPDRRTPHAPSTRVGRNHTTTAAAISQATDPRALRRTLRGELDWITIKALESDRERRYASASELATDVRRYLANEPVLAGPPGAWYRLRTFARRHRVPVAAGAFALFAMLAGGTAAVWGWIEARGQRDDAELARKALQHEASKTEQANQELKRQLQQSERASSLVIDWLSMINVENGPFDAGRKREMLDRAASEVGAAFASLPAAEAKVRKVLGEAYFSMGQNALAVEQFGRALALLDGVPEVTAFELYEVLSLYEFPLGISGEQARSDAIRERWYDTTENLFVEDHLELARLLHRLRGEHADERVAALATDIRRYADLHLADADRRWLALGDVLGHAVDYVVNESRNTEAGTPIHFAWYDSTREIYRDKVGLPPSNLRLMMLDFSRVETIGLSGRHADAAREAEVLAATFARVLKEPHPYEALARFLFGMSRVDRNDFEHGLPLLDEALQTLRQTAAGSDMAVHQLRRAVDANAAGGRSERADALRQELLGLLPEDCNGELRFGTVAAALGPEHSDLVAQMRACWQRCRDAGGHVSELDALRAECRRRFPIADARATVAAGGLMWFGNRFPTAAILPLLEDCVEVFRANGNATVQLLPRALWRLASVQIKSGLTERGLATARAGIGVCTGPTVDYWDGQFHRLVGMGLQQLGQGGAEEELVAGYDLLVDSAGLACIPTMLAHRSLQNYYLAQGRVRDGVAFAHQRLQRLLRQFAGPLALNETLWCIVRSPEGVGAAAESAVVAARRASALEPDSPIFRETLGGALLRAGQPAAALEELRQATRLEQKQGVTDATSIPAWSAIAYARLGQRADAIEALGRARAELARKPDGPSLRALVAEAEAVVDGR